MHQAYNVHSILKQGVQIESIAAYNNNVILGTRSGQLIMYSVAEGGSGAVDMLMFNKNFSKKAIAQMEVIAAEHLLFVLTDGMIHVCDISRIESNFAFIHSSPLTKGCTLFTLDVKTPKSTTGETATVIRVCCAKKGRLQFFYWKQDGLWDLKFTIELKDVPKALCWVDDVICVGSKDEYVLYDISSTQPEKHDLIVTSSTHSMDPCISLIKNNMLGVSKDEYLVTIDPQKYIKSEDTKPNAQGSMLAAVKKTEAKATPMPMMWSSPLQSLVWDEPYAVGRIASGIEIRSLEGNGINKDTLVQSIPELSKTKFLVRSGKGTIFAAAISELWCIRLADIPTQRQQLLQQKKFQLAIELTHVSEEPDEIRAETIRQIHMRYAKELFENKQFPAAMTEFEKANADPFDVLRLFPNFVQHQPKTSSPAGDVGVPVNLVPQLEDKDLENATLALVDFLSLARQKEIVKLRDTKNASNSLLSIIDTTLLKCYLQTNDSMIAPLLRLNECHFEESEKTLKKHNKIRELIILYHRNGKHKKALELLQAQAANAESCAYGRDRTISYLQDLGTEHLQLIFEYAGWVLAKYPEEGLRIFTDSLIEVETLPRANVLDFLLSNHKALVIPYLEHIINVWEDTNTLLHNVFVKQCREKVQTLVAELKAASAESKSEKEAELKLYRRKLYDMLKNSNYYSPELVLQDFPTNMLLEERALILGRLKKHDKVLAIYVQLLGDVAQAAAYCEAHYAEDNDIFVTLLKIILQPPKQPHYEEVTLHPDFLTPNHDVVLELLNKYAVKVDPHKIWQYLPEDMLLHRLTHYLDTVLRTQMRNEHELQIKTGLLSAELLRTKELIQQEEAKYVELTESSVCPECMKRFNKVSAFVRYPNGKVVHLSCHDKKAQQATPSSSNT